MKPPIEFIILSLILISYENGKLLKICFQRRLLAPSITERLRDGARRFDTGDAAHRAAGHAGPARARQAASQPPAQTLVAEGEGV